MSRFTMTLTLVFALAIASAHAGASTGTVTTNTYSASSTSTDINLSCKDLSLSVSGTSAKLAGTCNGGSSQTSIALESATTERVACPQSGSNAGKLVWGSGGFLANTASPHADTDATGKKYLLAGTCGIDIHNSVNDQAVDTLQLDGKITNKSGAFSFSP